MKKDKIEFIKSKLKAMRDRVNQGEDANKFISQSIDDLLQLCDIQYDEV